MGVNHIPEPVRLSKTEMRRLFNEHIAPKLESGELKKAIVKQRHADPIKSGQAFCTYSQLVSIQDKNLQEKALAHQYELPDKSLGATKRPDPVRMDLEGTIYKLRKQQDE